MSQISHAHARTGKPLLAPVPEGVFSIRSRAYGEIVDKGDTLTRVRWDREADWRNSPVTHRVDTLTRVRWDHNDHNPNARTRPLTNVTPQRAYALQYPWDALGSSRTRGRWGSGVIVWGGAELSDAHILLLGAIVIQARLDARRDPEAAEWLEGLRHRRYGVPVSCNPAHARGVKRSARH
jgi:hypothetical protein